jgi:AraC family transcriptional regulator, transcriptional activator FtrA
MPNDPTIAPAGPLVAVLAYDGLCTFEFGVAYEIFGLSRPEMGSNWYRYSICGIERESFTANGGLRVQATAGREVLHEADLIVVPGWRSIDAEVPAELIADLIRARARGARIMSLCSGIAVLAACGFLDGRSATTHWRYARTIRDRFPAIRLDPDRLYVDEGDVLTAAGSAAGIDLCLHVVRKDFGSEAANSVARRLVVPPHREGGQAQFIQRPILHEREGARLAPLIDWLRERLAQPHTIDTLAARAGMSLRTFQRRFEGATGLPPGVWLIAERVRLACEYLELDTQASLDDIAAACGFGTLASMRHHFRHRMGIAPAGYRMRFSIAARPSTRGYFAGRPGTSRVS